MTRSPARATPEIHSRILAEPGSLPHAALSGGAEIALPSAAALDPLALPPPRVARLGPEVFGTSGPETRSRLEAVLRGEGYFVSTGHQPVLLLGPFYVIYKTLTAISLAAHLERILERPVVPLFWIAADDHDWTEVGRTTLLDREDAARTLALSVPEGSDRRSVGSHGLSPSMMSILDKIDELLPISEFTSFYLKFIRDAYSEQATVSQAFARLLHAILGDRGYAWVDSAHPALGRAAVPLYRRMLEDWGAVLGAGDLGARRVMESGFEAPIAEIDGALPLFFDDGGGRRRLRRDGEGFRAAPSGPGESMGTWRDRLETSPARFSPNVASRPALESWLLPVAATVLGPGEIAYWSQLPPLFEALEVPIPSVQPRTAWTLIEPRIRRILDRTGVSARELAEGAEPAVARLTREARPETLERALRQLRERTESGLAEVEQVVGEQVPGLRAAVGKTRKGMLGAAAELSRQVDRETRRRLDIRLGQVRRAADNLFPGKRPQERTLSPLPFLCRYGPELLDRLERETDRRVGSSLAPPGTGG